jgi:putative phosphoesterase
LKILLLSDTHGYIDDAILQHALQADEIWHAGDFGTIEVSDQLSARKPLLGVYGNIDGTAIRKTHPEMLVFDREGVKVMMIHIGGYHGHFPAKVKSLIAIHRPALFVCGHSHILKVMRDPDHENMLCMNPGAAGRSGFHHVRTMLRFEINQGKIENAEVIELGKRTIG